VKLLGFKSRKNDPDEPALDAVRLDDDERTFHKVKI